MAGRKSGIGKGLVIIVGDGRYLKLDASNDPITETLELSKGLIVDTNTLYVDEVNHNVGIGTIPDVDYTFHVYKAGANTNSFSSDSDVTLWLESTGGYASLGLLGGSTNFPCFVWQDFNDLSLRFWTDDGLGGAGDRMLITGTGDVLILGGKLGILETGASPTKYVYLDAPDLVADITFVFPAALPASVAFFKCATDGTMSLDTNVYLTFATKIRDTDADTSLDAEETSDADTLVGKVAGVECLRFNNDGIPDLAKQSRARAYLNLGSTVIPNAAWTKVQLDGESYDNQSEYDNTTNYRFTAKRAGYYQVNANIHFMDLAASQRIAIGIYKNGALLSGSQNQTAYAQELSAHASDIVYLAVNDYIELWAYQDGAAANKNLGAYSEWTYMSIHKLS